jgi:hypothetical protein
MMMINYHKYGGKKLGLKHFKFFSTRLSNNNYTATLALNAEST